MPNAVGRVKLPSVVKVCTRCGEEREHHGRHRYGRLEAQNYCRECKVAYLTEWRHGKGREKFARSIKASRERHPARERARRLLNAAVQRGELVRGPCVTCGAPNGEAHHDDYSKPLVVTWVCRSHHRALDRQRQAVA
jgi:hypothetical protein